MILPGHPGLRLREFEPVNQERPCLHVEFANHSRIRATAGKGDQRLRVIRFDDIGSGPNPVLPVDTGQLVEIDDDIPDRCWGSVTIEGRSLPQSARVGRIAPEVIEVGAAPTHIGDPRIGIEDFQCLGAHLLESCIAERGDGGLVTFAHPGERVVTVDFFKP